MIFLFRCRFYAEFSQYYLALFYSIFLRPGMRGIFLMAFRMR